MDAAAWLAEFARREREYLTWRDARHARIAEKIRLEREPRVKVEIMPVVLTPGEEIDAGSDRVPSSARRLVAASVAAGWEARVVASTAAVPTSGLVNVVTVRARRHDERLWAAWRNGGFDVSWYVGPTGLERLGWARMGARIKRRGVLDVIEGVRGPKHWISMLERQEQDRAVGVLASAFPGLCLTRQ